MSGLMGYILKRKVAQKMREKKECKQVCKVKVGKLG